MGTTYDVQVIDPPATARSEALQAGTEKILQRVNALMSTYREDSEVSQFNRSDSTDWVDISAETRAVIDEALEVSQLTGGAFDITVAPLVDAWGFGAQFRENPLPSSQDIDTLLARVGYRHLATRERPPAVRKDRADVSIELSAIAKGYAVDRVAGYLEQLQIDKYLLEIGGEIKASGRNASGQLWQIAIEKPLEGRRSVQRVVALENLGMATSGDYRNFFERDGRRFSHTIDPRTGTPVEHDLASVAVTDPSTMLADALATAFMVLGPEDGFELASRENVAALFIIRSAQGFEERNTPGFAAQPGRLQ